MLTSTADIFEHIKISNAGNQLCTSACTVKRSFFFVARVFVYNRCHRLPDTIPSFTVLRLSRGHVTA